MTDTPPIPGMPQAPEANPAPAPAPAPVYQNPQPAQAPPPAPAPVQPQPVPVQPVPVQVPPAPPTQPQPTPAVAPTTQPQPQPAAAAPAPQPTPVKKRIPPPTITAYGDINIPGGAQAKRHLPFEFVCDCEFACIQPAKGRDGAGNPVPGLCTYCGRDPNYPDQNDQHRWCSFSRLPDNHPLKGA